MTDQDLGIETYQVMLDQQKQHFSTLIDELISAFNKEKQTMNEILSNQRSENDYKGTHYHHHL